MCTKHIRRLHVEEDGIKMQFYYYRKERFNGKF